MNWDHFRYFLAVAESGSLQGASRRLGVNHSTAFRRINAFESSVGARLFERLPDGYQLTSAGEELLEHARRIGDEIDQVSLKILGKDFKPSGTIRLTAPDNLAYAYLPAYLNSFLDRYTEIEIELVVGALSLDLTKREADIAVRATQNPPPHLVGRKAVSFAWGCYASSGYLKRNKRPKSWKNLEDHRLIGAEGALQRILPLRTLENSLANQIAVRCSTLNAMSALAEQSYGIAILPDDQIKPGLIRLFDTDPAFDSDIWILTHPELRRTERIRLLVDHLFHSFRMDPRIRRKQAEKVGPDLNKRSKR